MNYRSLATTIGRAKLQNAALLQRPLKIVSIEFGDGAGSQYEPTGLETSLRRKVYDCAPSRIAEAGEAETWIEIEAVIPAEVGGWYLREYLARDEEGHAIFIGNLPESFKPVSSSGAIKDIAFELLFDIQNADSVVLQVDPSQTIATIKRVEEMIATELAKLDHKHSVGFATTGPIALTGLDVQAGGDWTTALTTGTRILVKDQAAAKDNGLYSVSAAGVWTRSADADSSLEVTPGLLVHVERGTTNGDSIWQLVTDAPIVLGVTDLLFEMAAGRTGVNAGTYRSMTVDKYGRVVGGTNPTTLAGYAITDAFTKTETIELINGGVTSLSADTVLTFSQRGLVLIDASAGFRAITLPASNADLGVTDFIVRRVDNSGYSLVVQASGTDKIKFHTHLNAAGYPFLVLMGAGDWWHLRSDGSGGWWPVGRFDGTPLGRPVFETTTVFNPGGYGPLSGGLLIRASWPWLWDHAQQSGMLTTEAFREYLIGGWTTGDDATTFRCPDARGKFFRTHDESAGIDPGRVAGSYKLDELKEHAHYVGSGGYGTQAMGGGSITYATWAGGSTGVAGGSETVPKNIAYPGRMKMI